MTSQSPDLSFLETSDLGRRTLFQTFLNQQNQQLQSSFGIPSFGQGGIEQTPFQGIGGGGGFQSGQRNFLNSLFNPVFNQFLGQIGGQLGQVGEGGNVSTFGDFLQTDFNPQRELARATQRQQGINTGSLIGGRSRQLNF